MELWHVMPWTAMPRHGARIGGLAAKLIKLLWMGDGRLLLGGFVQA